MAILEAIGHGDALLRRWWGIWVVRGVDHDAVLEQIADESGWTGRYVFLILVSAALSMLGLLMPSVAVLIGAMLLSPLMMPIIGLGFGIATMDFKEIRRAAAALVLGSVLAIVLSMIMVAVSPLQTITSEIAGRTRPTLFDLLVALLSAVAGAYALIRGRGGTVVGVAIAIALMPPLAVVGFGLATWNRTVFFGSLLLFMTNAVTIALTAAVVARIYGFGSHLSPRHTGWQFALFVVALGLLSVPLAAGLQQIAFEQVAQRQVRASLLDHFPEGARLSQLEIDYVAQPLRVRAVMLTPKIDAAADRRLAETLGQRLDRPVDLHIDQLRIGLETGAVEAAQLAQAGDGSGSAAGAGRRAAAQLALISGQDPDAIVVDVRARAVRTIAAPLPGLPMEGYRALETRARGALPAWSVTLVPPTATGLPELPIEAGVIDPLSLDVAAWASARRGLAVLVDGGSRVQRDAVARAIVDRGGAASAGEAGGVLALRWDDPPIEVSEVRASAD